MNDKLYDDSIILIGTSGAGKLNVDSIAKRSRESGLIRKFKNADEFNCFLISQLIKKAKDKNVYGVVDFGTGHSVYDDKELATMIIYENERTPSVIADEIISPIE